VAGGKKKKRDVEETGPDERRVGHEPEVPFTGLSKSKGKFETGPPHEARGKEGNVGGVSAWHKKRWTADDFLRPRTTKKKKGWSRFGELDDSRSEEKKRTDVRI